MKTLGNILHDEDSKQNNSAFGKIVQQSQRLTKLNMLFKNFLEASLKMHCQLAQIEGSELVIIVDNASWATRLRYAIPEILKNIKTQPEFSTVKKIRYCIRLEANEELRKTQKSRLSPEIEQLWKDTLEKLAEKTKLSPLKKRSGNKQE